MRILVVSHLFPSSIDHSGIFIYNQTKALADQGVEARVLQPIPWAPWPLTYREKWRRYRQVTQETSWDGMEVTRVAYMHLPTGVLQPLAPLLLVPPLVRALRRIQPVFDFQLIHAHVLTLDGFAAVQAGRALHKPVVVSLRGSDVHAYPRQNAWVARQARFTLAHGDRFIAVSRALARQAETLGPHQHPAEVIYNGVDCNLFSPGEDQPQLRMALGLPPTGTILLTVGGLVPEKGVAELIAAFEPTARRYPELRLVVVGNGPMRAALESLDHRLGGGRVILPGAVSNRQVADYMRAADILLHPSHAEGLPNVVLEAMASELPVIATHVGGLPEVVVPGVTGLLFEAQDAGQLEAHLLQLLSDLTVARQMGQAGRARALAGHSWDYNAREHIRIYQALLNPP